MSRTVSKPRVGSTPASAPDGAVRFPLGNWILLAAGLVSVVAGFVFLDAGSLVAAPLLLMLGFLVLIPWGIIK